MKKTLWLAFQDLAEGDQFRFRYGLWLATSKLSDETYTKGKRGWFSDSRGRKYRTGKLTQVARVA